MSGTAIQPETAVATRRVRMLPGLLCVLALASLLCSCAGLPERSQPQPEISREWPVAGEGARIIYVRSIGDFDGLQQQLGFWGRALRVVAGGGDQLSIMRPYGVLHDQAGRVFLADPGAGLVHYLDLPRNRYVAIGSGKGDTLVSPIGVTSDQAGRVYITDSRAGMVYRYDPAERQLRPWLVKPLQRPTGIVFNPVNGQLYVADTEVSEIVALGQDGLERARLAGFGPQGRFNHPTDLAVDRKGQLYVTDSLNFRVVVLTPEGELLNQFGSVGDAPGQFSRPKGIALDSTGQIYVCDALHDAVLIFDRSGAPVGSFGRTGAGSGQFAMPSGIYIDANDYIYVTDTFNRRVQVFRYLPAEETLGGDLPNVPGRPQGVAP